MKLRSSGRGRSYSVWRGILESALDLAYRGDWPARLWGLFPRATEVSVTRHVVEIDGCGEGSPCRVAFVSDLHVGPTTPTALLERTVLRIRDSSPDVLLLGGDYVFLEAEPRRLSVLRDLVAAVPCATKVAVLGNHDLWADDRAIARALAEGGATVLVNESIGLPHPWTDVSVIGLDDPWTGTRDTESAFRAVEESRVKIVLCHSPDGLLGLERRPFDLFLAGHTHGGQIAAPWGPIVLPHGPLCREYPSGFGRFGAGTVYVSRGVGGVELPFRTFASPDVLLLELRRSANGSNRAAGSSVTGG